MKIPESQFNNFDGDPEYLSQEGFDRLQKELGDLKTNRRKEIAEKLEYALSLGDITENTEYQSAKEEQLIIESRIAELEDIFNRVVIISKEKGNNVQLGSIVSLKKESDSSIENYSLVGPEEVDSLKGKISHESPLGRALLGKTKGGAVSVLTPNGKINYTIVNIE